MKKLALVVPVLLLGACGGGGSTPAVTVPVSAAPTSITNPPKQEAFTFVDPTEAAGNKFGIKSVELSNGNIAVMSFESSIGAIHLYNPLTQALIKSIYGETVNDFHSNFTHLLPLDNGNLVIATETYDRNGISNSGIVLLINGATGDQIGNTFSSESNGGGSLARSGVLKLSNGNFVVASGIDNNGSATQAGSVMVIDGATGLQVGSTIYGNAGDQLSEAGSLTALNNGNFVVVSPQFNGFRGRVMLVDGATGAAIGSPINGDQTGDSLGSAGIVELDNGNYVIASPNDDHSGVVNAGTARLVNGTTGVQIATISGADAEDKVASGGVVALMNNEFAVSSPDDNDVLVSSGGLLVSKRGSAKFYNGSTGAQIGSNFIGSAADNLYGSGGIIQLSNGNIVVSTPFYEQGLPDQGRVDLINAAKSTHIAILYPSLDINPRFGFSGVHTVGDGNNFAVVSQHEDGPSLNDVGTVRVFNGATGAQVGTTVFGDNVGDSLGNAGVKVLENGNFIVASKSDDVNGISNAGSVMLFDGATGVQIGTTLSGGNADDEMGSSGVVALKGSSNYVVASPNVDVGGVANVGSVVLVDGSTGAQIGDATEGNDADDQLGEAGASSLGLSGVKALSNGDYLITSEYNDDNGNTDVGAVLYRLGK